MQKIISSQLLVICDSIVVLFSLYISDSGDLGRFEAVSLPRNHRHAQKDFILLDVVRNNFTRLGQLKSKSFTRI